VDFTRILFVTPAQLTKRSRPCIGMENERIWLDDGIPTVAQAKTFTSGRVPAPPG